MCKEIICERSYIIQTDAVTDRNDIPKYLESTNEQVIALLKHSEESKQNVLYHSIL